MSNIYASLPTGALVAIIIGGAIVLGGGFFLLYYFVLSRNSIKRQVRDLERKYSYLDALLIGQDSQYIHRIEIISRTNLLYVDKYENFSRRFKEIYDNDDKFAESMIRQLNALLANNQYKNIKSVILDARKAVQNVEEKVNALDADLFQLIKPEEDSRQSILKLKEAYRRVKQIFYANANDLDLVSTSFTRVFEKLDQQFIEFEDYIESAKYDEAQALIPTIDKVVKALDEALELLPNLCILINKVIPEKIDLITTEYRQTEKKDIPLYNLTFKARLNNWHSLLKVMKSRLSNLQTGGVMSVLEDIQKDIDQVRILLKEEVDAKEFFKEHCDEYYAHVIEIEKSFLKICSILPEVNKIYVIDQEQIDNIATLKQEVSDLGAAKRTMDNYIHSTTKQPYSVLKKKLEEMQELYVSAFNGVNSFKAYLEMIRNACEEAYTLVFVYYYRAKHIESTLREIAIDCVIDEFKPNIDSVFDLLNDLDITVKTRPINVNHVNEVVEQLKTTANALFENVETKYRDQQLAESAIVYANRDRRQQADVHQQLSLLEKSFFNGEFLRVYHDTNSLYHENHIEENQNA